MNETDRAWLAEMIRSVVSDELVPIKVSLEGLSSRVEGLTARVEGISERVDGLTARVDGLEQAIKGLVTIEMLAAAVAELKEMIYDSETRMLTEFHKWAGPVDQKLRSHREALRALDLQIEEIAGRVKGLEDRMEQRH